MPKPIKDNPFLSHDWTPDTLQKMWSIIRGVAKDEFGLDFYEPSFEIVTFEEMLQIYTTGFPIMFHHWTFGKQYEDLYKQYRHNRTSIAYEVIFNTDPALCYLLETNTSTMQALVMSHAAVGHSAFFKGNSFIRENTNAKSIISFLKSFRNFVQECENTYGAERVEEILDVCQSLSMYAIDRQEVVELSKAQKEKKRIQKIRDEEFDVDLTIDSFIDPEDPEKTEVVRLKEENLLKFVAKHSPALKQWERDIILMFCKTQQYFYPQIFTKLMNEGYASFWHYTLMNKLYDLGYLHDGNILEFLQSHTGVLCQHDHDSKYYNGFNPYKLGFELFAGIRRICENPTEEDKATFPHLVGQDWKKEIQFAMENFKDESFVQQYLTPKLIRDLKLFAYKDDTDRSYYEIKAVHSDEDFKEIRTNLSRQYNIFNKLPHVFIEGADFKKSRTLYIVLKEENMHGINWESAGKSLMMLKKLWPYRIRVKMHTKGGNIMQDDL